MNKNQARSYNILHKNFSLLPKIVIINNKNNKIGYLNLILLIKLFKTINVYQQNSTTKSLFKINKNTSNPLVHSYTINGFNPNTDIKNVDIKHIGYRNIYKKHSYEIKVNNNKLYMAYERSNRLTKLSTLILMIPAIGEILHYFLILIPQTYQIYYYNTSANKKEMMADIKIRSNFFSKNIQLFISDENIKNDLIYISFGILLYF